MLKYEIFVTKKVRDILAILEHPLRPRPYYALHPRQHALHMIIKEKNILSPQLSNNTAERPNINALIKPTSKDNLRRPITPRLHITTQIHIMNVRAIAQVNHSDL